MITLDKLIYNLKNSLRGGSVTDDFGISDRQIEFILDHFRAEVASQRANNNKSVEGLYQNLDNVKLIGTRDFRAVSDDITILRSKDRIPSIVSKHTGGYIVDFVGTKDDYLGFHRSTVANFNLDIQNTYISNLYFINDDYVYIITKDRAFLREVFIKAVFGSPRDVGVSNGVLLPTTGTKWKYPIPANLINQVNNLAINNEFRWASIFPSDDLNDGNDAKQQGN